MTFRPLPTPRLLWCIYTAANTFNFSDILYDRPTDSYQRSYQHKQRYYKSVFHLCLKETASDGAKKHTYTYSIQDQHTWLQSQVGILTSGYCDKSSQIQYFILVGIKEKGDKCDIVRKFVFITFFLKALNIKYTKCLFLAPVKIMSYVYGYSIYHFKVTQSYCFSCNISRGRSNRDFQFIDQKPEPWRGWSEYVAI